MLLPCSRALAVFAPEGIALGGAFPARMQWDEHGGTFVLRLTELEVSPVAETPAASGIWLEVALPLPESLLSAMREFAGAHRLPLTLPSPPPAELAETPMLAAAHVPGPNRFIYCEEPALRARALGPQALEIAVTGVFKARRLPCQEPDVIIHLTAASMSRLLAALMAWARKGQ
jgi:hypothetical protein